jgi:hypothetical protein
MLQGICSLDPVLCVVTPCSLVDSAVVLEEPVVVVFGLGEQNSARYMPVLTGHNGIKMYGEVEVGLGFFYPGTRFSCEASCRIRLI